jgi:predicted nucleotidyltransferase
MDFKDVSKNIIFSTITGSKAYGTNTKDSDTDTRGVAIIDNKNLYFGFLNSFEQYEDKVNDTVIYGIQKAMRLMSDCNPNMLELPFVEERFWLKSTPYWNRIIDSRDLFLSKKVRFTYSGYAYSQLKRIKTARSWLLNPPKKKPERSDYGLPEQKLFGKEEMGAFQWILVNMLKDSVDYLNFSDSTKEELKKSNFIGRVQHHGIPEESFEQIQKVTGASDAWMDSMQR